MDLADFLGQNGYDIVPTFNETLTRFVGHSRSSKSGWYIGFDDTKGKYLLIGDWATGENHTWYSKLKLKDDEFIKQKISKAKLDQINLKIEMQNHASDVAVKYLTKNKLSCGIDDFEYCRKKKISHIGKSEICEDQFGPNLSIPISDISGKIWSLQKIYSDGHKLFLPGGKITGCFFTFGELQNGAKIYVCEGFATGASIFESTGVTTVVAFFAGNLKSVCSDLVIKYPVSEIVICADNDQFSKKNAGISAAQDCQIKYNIKFVYPKFSDGLKDYRPTDFNDLFCLSGKEECKKQISSVTDSVIQKTDEYMSYKNLFEILYPTAKKCVLTGQVTYEKNNDRISILNESSIIRANAKMAGLPKANVEDYLSVWLNEKKPELLINIPEYDNKDYIGQLLSYLEVSNIEHKYFVELMKYWFANVFARFFDNNHQNTMVILHGNQGIGKDTFIENMFNGFRPYFSSTGIHEKEIENYQTMSRHLILNISEFDRTSKMHVAQLKNIITANEATFRLPYAKEPSTVKFRTSFISSCNIEDVFRDETGNRRYMLFKISSVDWNYPKGLSAMIMSQAMHLYMSKFEPSIEAIKANKLIIQEMTPDSWEDNAAELWNSRIEAMCLNSSGQDTFSFSEIALLPFEIAKVVGVKQKMVNSFIKRRFQIRTDGKRLYASDYKINSLKSNKQNLLSSDR